MARNDEYVAPIPGKQLRRDANGFDQIAAARSRAIEDRAVRENPVGPPALLPQPAPNNGTASGALVNPTVTDLYREGALRPATGPFSAADPQPEVDAGGRVLPTRPLATATATAPASAGPGVSPITPAATAIAPTIATVTPATAANARELTRAGAGAAPRLISSPDEALRNANLPAAPGATPAGGATSISGRQLGYGANVDGVRVFSDGTGGANAPARTMTDEQIAGLATGSRLSRADAGIGGAIGSAAAGGTPELGAFTGRVGELTRPSATGTGIGVDYARARADNIEALRAAASDAASIASRDSRSVLGRAARNADVDARSSFGSPRLRREKLASALEGLNRAALAGVQGQAELGRAAVDDAGQTTRAGINAQASVAGDALRRPGASQVTLDDGTLGLVGADGVVRPAVTPDGTPARTLQTRDDTATKRAAEVQDSIAKTAATLLSNETLGQAATPQQIADARARAAQLHGLRTATDKNGVKVVEIAGEWKPL